MCNYYLLIYVTLLRYYEFSCVIMRYYACVLLLYLFLCLFCLCVLGQLFSQFFTLLDAVIIRHFLADQAFSV